MQLSSNCAQENMTHGIKFGSAALRSETKVMLRSSCRRDLHFTVSIPLVYFLINHLCNFLQVKYLPNFQYKEKLSVTTNAQFV